MAKLINSKASKIELEGKQLFDLVTKKNNAKKSKLQREKDEKVILESIVKIVKRRTKEQGKEEMLNFYGGAYDEYFADYVRFVKGKKVTTSEAIEILNDDLIKNTSGMLINSLRTTHNIQNAYITFKNACANVQIQLAKQYGADNYYELDKIHNENATEVYNNFENWQKAKEAEFKQMFKLDDEFMKVRTSANPMKELSKDGFVLAISVPAVVFGSLFGALIGIVMGCIIDDLLNARYEITFSAVFSVSLAAFILLFSCNSYDIDYIKELDSIAADYGFENGIAMINAIKESNYAYLSKAEVAQLEEIFANSNKEMIAKQAGYDNLLDALTDISNHSSEEICTKKDMLSNVANERSLANDLFAKQNGFDSYNDVIQYLNSHKILTGEATGVRFGGAGWSVYDYDSATARIISCKIIGLESCYDELVRQIENGGLYQTSVVYDNDEIAKLVMEMNAYNNVSNCQLKYIMNNNDGTIFYTDDFASLFAGNEALDAAESVGKSTIVSRAINGKVLYSNEDFEGVAKRNLNDYLADKLVKLRSSEVSSQAIDANDNTYTLDAFGCGGLAVGAGLCVALKCNKQLRNVFKQHKINKEQEKINEIKKQVEKELER